MECTLTTCRDVYYLLGNLRSIQLLAVVKAPIIEKYGMEVILEPFMRDLKVLEEVSIIFTMFASHPQLRTLNVQVGITVESEGQIHVLKGYTVPSFW